MTLKQTLNKLEDMDFEELSMDVLHLDEEEIEKTNKKELIKDLEEVITTNFEDIVKNNLYSELIEIITDVKTTNKTTKYDDKLVSMGILHFTDEDDEFFIPKDLIDIYDKSITKDILLEMLLRYTKLYININHIIPISFIEDNYISKLKLDITNKEYEEYIKEEFIIEDNYIQLDYNEQTINQLKNEYKELTYLVLDTDELLNQAFLSYELLEELKNITKNSDLAIELNRIIFDFPTPNLDDLLKTLNKENNFKLNINSIMNIYQNRYKDMRFALNKGRTIEENGIEEIIRDSYNKNYKNNTLKELIKKCNEDELSTMKDLYQVNDIENLCNEIIKLFKYTNSYKINSINNQEASIYNVDLSLVLYGNIFIDKGKIIVPKEILEITEEYQKKQQELNETLDFDKELECSFIVNKAIESYGIINRKKLQELLEEKNIEISINLLDHLVKCNEGIIKEGLYMLNYFTESPKEEIKDMLDKKEKIVKYKKLDDIDLGIEDEIAKKINDIISRDNEELEYDELIEIVDLMLYQIKDETYSKNEIKDILDFYKIHLSNKNKLDIFRVLENNKDNISIWSLNGYTKNDMKKNK